MPEADRGPAKRTGEADMTSTEMNCNGIPRETIAISRQRARRMRSRVVFRLMRRVMRQISAGPVQPAPTPIRPAPQPV
jgi:hypothetical protein